MFSLDKKPLIDWELLTNRTPSTRSYRPNWTPLSPITIINHTKTSPFNKQAIINGRRQKWDFFRSQPDWTLCGVLYRVNNNKNYVRADSIIILFDTSDSSRFKFDESAKESTRVTESAWEFQAKRERESELSATLILVWPGLNISHNYFPGHLELPLYRIREFNCRVSWSMMGPRVTRCLSPFPARLARLRLEGWHPLLHRECPSLWQTRTLQWRYTNV